MQHARYANGQDIVSLAGVGEILRSIGLLAAAEGLRTPDQELKQTYHRQTEAARSEMRRFGISGVPALLVGEGTERHLLQGNLLFGRFDLLVSQLQAA